MCVLAIPAIFDLCTSYMDGCMYVWYGTQQYTIIHTVRPNNTLSYAFTRIKEPMKAYTTERMCKSPEYIEIGKTREALYLYRRYRDCIDSFCRQLPYRALIFLPLS